MATGNTWSNGILGLLFNATTVANIAINATSAPLTSLYISLHTANPGAAGNQTTSEAAYTSYARVAVPRNSSGFTVSGTVANFTSNVSFPTATGGSETETYFGIGTASSGTGILLYSGTITPTIAVTNGVTPVLTTASNVTES